MISAGLLVLALVVSAEAAAIVVGAVIVFWAIGMVVTAVLMATGRLKDDDE